MIHFFVGTKAQLIKLAPIMRSLQDRGIQYNHIQSGQHKDTMDDILDNFRIHKRPDTFLYNGEDITGVTQMARWALAIIRRFGSNHQLSRIFKDDKSGVVLNHGDTISTLIGSYLAHKYGLKSAHIESGLRSFNILHPFPEELTRLLTFRLSDYFFAPGEWAMDNLKKHEGIKINTHHNTLYDALAYSNAPASLENNTPYSIISIHRFENIFSKRRLTFIIDSLIDADNVVKKRFILHNPTRKKLLQFGLYDKLATHPSIELHPRYDYFRFTSMLKGARYLISDGGSNQEESYYLGLPCLLMRRATERTEGLGRNVVLSHYDKNLITEFIQNHERHRYPPIQVEERPTDIIIRTLQEAGLT